MRGEKMSYHQLRCQQPYFDALLSGDKTFEVRLNDRPYQVGDEVGLEEVGGEGRAKYEVTYVLPLDDVEGFWNPESVKELGLVVLGLAPLYHHPVDFLRSQLTQANSRIAELQSQLSEAMEMLRELEWMPDDGIHDWPVCPECGRGRVDMPFCPWCGRWKGCGHSPDCRLNNLLKEGE
ncbi:MAG: DUF3850 domain-containing protein [Minisyncoccota bacterium]